MPKAVYRPGGEGYNLTREQKEKSFDFQLQEYVWGYGYSSGARGSARGSTASRVAIIILLIQLSIAASFILWTITTGTSSTSWDSPTELISLALASEVPAEPKRLATGEAPVDLMKKQYCVAAEGRRLQL